MTPDAQADLSGVHRVMTLKTDRLGLPLLYGCVVCGETFTSNYESLVHMQEMAEKGRSEHVRD